MNEKCIKELSSAFTDNRVYYCEHPIDGAYIKKVYTNRDKLDKELTGYQEIKEAYRPKLLKFSYETLSIYTSYNPLKHEVNDQEVVDMLYDFHMYTLKVGHVYFPVDNHVYENWNTYIVSVSKAWSKHLSQYYVNIQAVLQTLIEAINIPNPYDNRISYIHRDVRMANFGERDNKLILFDFELGIWGNPLWDVARYGYENLENTMLHRIIIQKYGIDEQLYLSYMKLYGISFLNYILKTEPSNYEEVDKCIGFLGLIKR